MEKQNNNKGVITLLIVIIIILATLCVLFATGTINFNSNKMNGNDVNQDINENDNNNQTNEDNNIDDNILSINNVFKKLVGTYKTTSHSDACGVSETTLTIHNNGTADLYMNTCVGDSVAKNAIFSLNEKQIYLIDKTCEMFSSNDGGSCTIGGGCYSGGCSPLWTFDYSIDGLNVAIEDLIKQ